MLQVSILQYFRPALSNNQSLKPIFGLLWSGPLRQVLLLYLFSCLSDGPEENSSKLLSTPFVEDSQHRLKWVAYLEFTHNEQVEDLTWDKVRHSLRNIEEHSGSVVECLTLDHGVAGSCLTG